jgi:hypothetical protein
MLRVKNSCFFACHDCKVFETTLQMAWQISEAAMGATARGMMERIFNLSNICGAR